MERHLNYIYVCCSLSGRSFIIVYFLREGNRVKVKMYDFSLKTRELRFAGKEMRRVGCVTRSLPKNFFAKKPTSYTFWYLVHCAAGRYGCVGSRVGKAKRCRFCLHLGRWLAQNIYFRV